MAIIIIELSFLLYKVVSLHSIQETIQSAIEKYNIETYYLDFEIQDKKRTDQKGVYTVHFEETKLNTLSIVDFLRRIKLIPNVHLECVYRDNISCDIIYASKFYLQNMETPYQKMYEDNKRDRRYSETEFELLKGIQCIFKNNKKYFKNGAPPANYEDYLMSC
jgi:hypothetical protein|tara:strand:+ start:2596 stop:3084 length:489 start_codon:yes stop_codon:yes gene_type:complete